MSARLLFGSPAENILDLALSSGAQAAEAFFQQGVELRARAFEGALAELTSAQARGAGLRTFGTDGDLLVRDAGTGLRVAALPASAQPRA